MTQASLRWKLLYLPSCEFEGDWELLTEKIEVNEKSVPDPVQLPIPGAVEIHVHADE